MPAGFVVAAGPCGVKSIMGFTGLASRKGKHPAMGFDWALFIIYGKEAGKKRGWKD